MSPRKAERGAVAVKRGRAGETSKTRLDYRVQRLCGGIGYRQDEEATDRKRAHSEFPTTANNNNNVPSNKKTRAEWEAEIRC